MAQVSLKTLTIDQLVDRFAEIAIAQGKAGDDLVGRLWDSNGEDTDTSEIDRLFGDMKAIDEELRKRGRDARLALTQLFDHRNIQVRLSAAKLTLGVTPLSSINPQRGRAPVIFAST